MKPFLFLSFALTIYIQGALNCCTNVKNDRNGQHSAYMALVIQLVVGQFELVEANDLSHPRLARSRRVRVDVHARRDGRIRISCHHPLGTVVHVSIKR